MYRAHWTATQSRYYTGPKKHGRSCSWPATCTPSFARRQITLNNKGCFSYNINFFVLPDSDTTANILLRPTVKLDYRKNNRFVTVCACVRCFCTASKRVCQSQCQCIAFCVCMFTYMSVSASKRRFMWYTWHYGRGRSTTTRLFDSAAFIMVTDS
jgi:hypothetical protein